MAINTGGAVAGLGIGVALIAFTTRRRTHLENAVESKEE
jgi:hypothetical protein